MSQNEFAFGCSKPTKDFRDYRLNNKIAFASDLPDSFEVDISDIKSQGSVCSCVAFSVVESLEAMNKNVEKYSTNWIYGYRPVGYLQGKGMSIRQAIKTTKDVGYVLYDDFPGNTEMYEVKELVDSNLNELKDKAKDRKTFAYVHLNSRDEIKRAIYSTKHPVIISVHCCDPFQVDEYGILEYSNSFSGYHAMVCYGWNEQGLLIQNSWGTWWGNNGTCILPEVYPYSEAWMIANTEDEYLVMRPKGFWFRQLLQAVLNFIVRLFNSNKS